MVDEIGEACQFQEFADLSARDSRPRRSSVTQSEVVGDEDGIEPGGECRVDVGAGAVADHPSAGGFARVVGSDTLVGLGVLLVKDLNGGEVAKEAGAVELAGLLDRIALGNEDQPVAGGEIGQSLRDAGEEFNLMVSDGLGEAKDAGVFFRGDGGIGELLEAVDQRAAEAPQAITMGGDSSMLAEVEAFADLFGGVDTVIQIGDERGDGPFKVNVVLPRRVIGVYQEGLSGCYASHFSRSRHTLSIGGMR